MRCPTLSDLPPPLPGRVGWPWTEESPQLPDTMPDGSLWPRVTIVTPSYNQGQFIEETIRSVLLQGYPNLEYFVVDGGSTDGSAKVIDKYADYLAWWCSEEDQGQSDAINKGLARANGQILAWLNSDDRYLPGCVSTIADAFAEFRRTGMIYGNVEIIDEQGQLLKKRPSHPYAFADQLTQRLTIPQQAAFWRTTVMHDVGWLSFRRDQQALACLRWWRDRCIEWCYDRVDNGRFGDQKYLDDWPTRFRDVIVLQHKGANLAPWNLANYSVGTHGNQIWVDEQPLVFFHFHGLEQVRSWLWVPNFGRYSVNPPRGVRRKIYVPYIRELLHVSQRLSSLLPQSMVHDGIRHSSTQEATQVSACRRVTRQLRRSVAVGREILVGRCILPLDVRVIWRS